jgi:hypothetical protein
VPLQPSGHRFGQRNITYLAALGRSEEQLPGNQLDLPGDMKDGPLWVDVVGTDREEFGLP